MSLGDREREIAQTRERLNSTIDRIQDKLTVSGIVDEVLGSKRLPAFDARYEKVLDAVRRNPLPVLVIAAGLGFVLNRMARRERLARGLRDPALADLPVLNTGRARVYDSDTPAVDAEIGALDGRHGARS